MHMHRRHAHVPRSVLHLLTHTRSQQRRPHQDGFTSDAMISARNGALKALDTVGVGRVVFSALIRTSLLGAEGDSRYR